jgi:hypothetical protein
MAEPRYQSKKKKNPHFWVSQHDNFFELRTHGGGYLVQKFPSCANVPDIMQVVKGLGCKNMAEVVGEIMFLKRSVK